MIHRPCVRNNCTQVDVSLIRLLTAGRKAVRLTIATAGSRGDVQPYVALGLGLQAAGHQVNIAAEVPFKQFVTDHGLAFAPLHRDTRAAFSDCVDRVDTPPAMLHWLKAHYTPDRVYFEDLLLAMRGSDAALLSFLAFPAVHVAEALGIPWLGAFLQPWTPSRAFSWALPVHLPGWLPESVRGEINWWSGRSVSALMLRVMREAVDVGRREVLGLPPVSVDDYLAYGSAHMPAIYGYSRHLVPAQPAWTPNQRVTGFWFLQSNGWSPPAALERFLAEGEAPVVVGFGSMADCDAQHTTSIVMEALDQVGARGILLGGWAGLGEGQRLPKSVLRLEEAPHNWLLPRAAAIVHHGGAGTTAAALRAGIVAVTVPFFGDQAFWGQRVEALGAGPAPIKRSRLTTGRLVRALKEALAPDKKECASLAGEKIRTEDGVRQAVAAVEELLDRR
jgi:sterol 3beta-glucosyltransferase